MAGDSVHTCIGRVPGGFDLDRAKTKESARLCGRNGMCFDDDRGDSGVSGDEFRSFLSCIGVYAVL